MEIILETYVGSRLYGTNTENSDVDIQGIFIPSKNYFYGLDKVQEIFMNTVSKDEHNKNTKDAVDKKLLEIRYFLKKAIEGEFNVIEPLFANENSIISISDIGRKLVDIRHMFLTKAMIRRMLAFEKGISRKILDIDLNLEQIKTFYDDISKIVDKTILRMKLSDIKTNFKSKNDFLLVGKYKFSLNQNVKCAIHQAKTLLESLENRKEKESSVGYDVKTAYHSYRTLCECEEILQNKTITFPLKETDILMDIRNGKISLDKLDEMLYNKRIKVNEMLQTSDLRNKADYNFINDFCIEVVEKWLK